MTRSKEKTQLAFAFNISQKDFWTKGKTFGTFEILFLSFKITNMAVAYIVRGGKGWTKKSCMVGVSPDWEETKKYWQREEINPVILAEVRVDDYKEAEEKLKEIFCDRLRGGSLPAFLVTSYMDIWEIVSLFDYAVCVADSQKGYFD